MTENTETHVPLFPISATATIGGPDSPPLRYRHKKRGTTYRVLSSARLQVADPTLDMTSVVVYQDEESGLVWVRPEGEFFDGRFEAI